MKWYSGSIADAVALSKEKKSIFVVYIEGEDELSQRLRGFINDEKISGKLEGDEFVAVRIESGSEAYMQFAQIYQLVPLPSIFFIGLNGVPLEVVTGVVASSDELENKINKVLTLSGFKINESNKLQNDKDKPTTSNTIKSTVNLISAERATAGSSNVVCDGDVCYKLPNEPPKTDATKSNTNDISKVADPDTNSSEKPATSNDLGFDVQQNSEEVKVNEETPSTLPEVKSPNSSQNTENTEEKVERIKKILEEKKKEREAEEARLEHEAEIKRRKEGQEVTNLKKWKEEHELKELQESIRRKRIEEQAARQRVLEKIASDKAERAQRFGQIVSPPKPEESKPSTVPSPPNRDGATYSRIQFRKPDGESEMHSFMATDTFETIRNHVQNVILQGSGIKEFSLATTFPRREFTFADDFQTLQELGLCPTAVLLIIARTSSGPSTVVARSGGVVNMFNSIVWGILTPFLVVFDYLRNFVYRRRTSSAVQTESQKRADEATPNNNDTKRRRNLDRYVNSGNVNDTPSTSNDIKHEKPLPYRRVGNSNIHRLRDQRDSDDENNTWNGNSTQQQ